MTSYFLESTRFIPLTEEARRKSLLKDLKIETNHYLWKGENPNFLSEVLTVAEKIEKLRSGQKEVSDEEGLFCLPRTYVEENWTPSFSLDTSKEHFREEPPGTGHAVCEPDSDICEVHYDKVNPYDDVLGHLIEDSPEVLAELGPAAMESLETYKKTKSYLKAFISALKTKYHFFIGIYRVAKWAFYSWKRK